MLVWKGILHENKAVDQVEKDGLIYMYRTGVGFLCEIS